VASTANRPEAANVTEGADNCAPLGLEVEEPPVVEPDGVGAAAPVATVTPEGGVEPRKFAPQTEVNPEKSLALTKEERLLSTASSVAATQLEQRTDEGRVLGDITIVVRSLTTLSKVIVPRADWT